MPKSDNGRRRSSLRRGAVGLVVAPLASLLTLVVVASAAVVLAPTDAGMMDRLRSGGFALVVGLGLVPLAIPLTWLAVVPVAAPLWLGLRAIGRESLATFALAGLGAGWGIGLLRGGLQPGGLYGMLEATAGLAGGVAFWRAVRRDLG